MNDIQKQLYASMKQLCLAEGQDLAIIKLAKLQSAPGFEKNNQINWTELKPWLEVNKNKLSVDFNDTLPYYKKENAKRDMLLKDLDIKKKKGEYLEPQQVMDFLKKISTAQNALFISRMKSLAPKLVGLNEIEISIKLNEMISEVCNIFSKGLSVWKP